MKAFLTLTPESNVDQNTKSIIKNEELHYKLLDWNEKNVVKKRFGKDSEKSEINTSNISVYDHSIILNDLPYCILDMFSKESFDDNPKLLALVGMKPETMFCTKCHGSGDRPYARGNHSSVFRTRPCGLCGGSGRIPYE